MAEQKLPLNVVSEAERANKPILDIKTNEEQDEKYQSQPEGKGSLADYVVCIHNSLLLRSKLIPAEHVAHILLCNQMGHHFIDHGIRGLYRGRNSQPPFFVSSEPEILTRSSDVTANEYRVR